jgi:hypothetical protein
VLAAKVLTVLAIVVLGFSALASLGVFTGTDRQPEPATGGFLFTGACIALATWLYLIGQVVLIRAALEERQKDKG